MIVDVLCEENVLGDMKPTLRTNTFGRKNFRIFFCPKIFRSETWVCRILLKSLKIFKNIVGLIKQQHQYT